MKSLLEEITRRRPTPASKQTQPGPAPVPVQTKYESIDVAIPDDFLRSSPTKPVTIKPVDWSQTPLPENKERYAVVLDNVMTLEECGVLLSLVEASVPPPKDGDGEIHQFWKPALVNIGGGYEVLQDDYRKSDRIIWDQQEVVDRIWKRCLLAPGLQDRLGVLESDEVVLGPVRQGKAAPKWVFDRVNKRMRFLRYGAGEFFRAHCDGPYGEEVDDRVYRTHFTLHLYLNDSVAEAEVGTEGVELVGGATSFLSWDENRRVDVNPKAGRVLIFQHRGLYHSGDEVVKGIKYTMRSDIMYELIRPKAEES